MLESLYVGDDCNVGLFRNGLQSIPPNVATAGLARLVALLSHRSDETAEKAAKAFTVLVGGVNDAVRKSIVAAGALPPLVALLGHSCAGVAKNAARALSSLASYGSGWCELILAAGALAPLVVLLEHLHAESATRALSNLIARNDARCELILAADT